MTEQAESFFKRRWKLIVNIITLIALAILIYAIRDQLVQTLKDFRRVSVWVLLLMIPLQFLNYHAQTKTYQNLFHVVGNKLRYWPLFQASLELNFVNHVFPSGGVTGVSYFGVRMKDSSITGSRATLVQVMKLALLILSFEILLIAGLFFMAIVGKASGFVLFIAGGLSMLMVLGTLAFVYIIGSRRRINSFFIGATKGLNKIIQIVRRKHPETINIEGARRAFDDLHENYVAFRTHRRELGAPFWWSLMANVTEVNVGAVILAYAVANFAGFVSVLPGGVGIYEALMTAVLSAGGVPAAISLPVTVMYRVINTVIQIPPGYYFYSRALKGNKS
jgi:uncharacterized membrane protein YbhN (UPF0104 family)